MNKYSTKLSLRQILYAYNRRAELQRLIAWAKRKHLARPRRLYQNRLMDIEVKLSRYQLIAPDISRRAYLLHKFSRYINPTPRYPRHGLAAGYGYPKYQKKNLTGTTKSP